MDKSLRIPLQVLEQTTEGFADKHMIGSGGYGNVYKVLIENISFLQIFVCIRVYTEKASC